MKQENAWEINSPDGAVQMSVKLQDGALKYSVQAGGKLVIEESNLGVLRNDADLTQGLKFTERSEPRSIKENLKFITGKQLAVNVDGIHQTLTFANPQGISLTLEVKVFDDGLAMRYVFPDSNTDQVTVEDDITNFSIPPGSRGWLQPYDEITTYTPAYEKYFENGIVVGDTAKYGNGWCFPALFKVKDQWMLLSEAGIDGDYAGLHLDNDPGSNVYRLRWPEQDEANGLGDAKPSGAIPWHTSWKTMAIGDLNTIVKSELVKIVSAESRIDDKSWIRPGRVSWSWLSDHPSPRDFDKLKSFVDLAAEMGWEYSLVDANWDQMAGGTIEELITYAQNKGVGILMWYNSGGAHNDVTEAPRGLIDDPDKRRAEFKKLRQLGVKGIKVDFFQSDKQDMMVLYKQILEDAAEFEILVNFHGCTIPRGWSRTYPNLMTMESVRGGESYTFAEDYPENAPELNVIVPFTRNVIGSMDYTPVIFSQMQYPHITTYGHEIALAVVFESGWLHFGDGVEGYRSLGSVEKQFLRDVPVTWDEVELISGTPGKDIIIARRKGDSWYVGGINGESISKSWSIDLSNFEGDFLVTSITDGKSPDQLESTTVEESGTIDIEVLAYGGFILRLEPKSGLAQK